MKFLVRVSILFCLFSLILWGIIARPFSIGGEETGQGNQINPEDLKKNVKIISEEYFPRNHLHPETLRDLSSYLNSEFSQFTSRVSYQEYIVAGRSYRNVVARFGPESNELLVLGAHYDAYGDLPGADDNASGVAALLELARLLKTIELNVAVELVAYTLEEPPHFASEYMGSYIHARSLKESDIQVRLMISVEMIGYFTDAKDTQKFPVPYMKLIYPSEGNFIAVVENLTSNHALSIKSAINRYSNIEAYSISAPAKLPGIDFSDHRNYWEFGFPAVMVTDTSFYRNDAYHTERDTYTRLDYEKMAEVVWGLFKYIESLK